LELLIEHEEVLHPLPLTLERFLAVKAVYGFIIGLMGAAEILLALDHNTP
jgi:hypothetical protein